MESADIKAIRLERKLTQAEFAELLGVSIRSVQAYEKGKTKPSALNLLRLIELQMQNSTANMLKNISEDKQNSLLEDNFTLDSFVNEEPINYKPEGRVIDVNELPVKDVYVIPIKGRGGLENAFYDDLILSKLKKEKLQLKKKASEGSRYFKIEVEGVSMDDSTNDFDGSKYSLAEGDWAYCRSIARTYWKSKLHINSVKVFCFFHNTRGIIFKKIKSHNVETGELVLTSLNPDKNKFPDFTINVAECSYICNVIKVLSEF